MLSNVFARIAFVAIQAPMYGFIVSLESRFRADMQIQQPFVSDRKSYRCGRRLCLVGNMMPGDTMRVEIDDAGGVEAEQAEIQILRIIKTDVESPHGLDKRAADYDGVEMGE